MNSLLRFSCTSSVSEMYNSVICNHAWFSKWRSSLRLSTIIIHMSCLILWKQSFVNRMLIKIAGWLNTPRPSQSGRFFHATLWNAFPWMQLFVFWFKLPWILFLLFQIIKSALVHVMNFIRQGDRHYWYLCWLRCIYAYGVTRLWRVNPSSPGQNGRHFGEYIRSTFPLIKRLFFWLKFHWSLFLRVRLTKIKHWFR